MRLVNPKASTFLAILEIFCSGVCVRELLAYGTRAPIGRITSFSAKFTDAPLAEGKFETYMHERENAKKPRAVRLSRPQLPMINCTPARAPLFTPGGKKPKRNNGNSDQNGPWEP